MIPIESGAVAPDASEYAGNAPRCFRKDTFREHVFKAHVVLAGEGQRAAKIELTVRRTWNI